jgi:putative PIN family toxin of toxin-antitoxin system
MNASTTPAAVLDTNLTISGAITPHGIPTRILRAYERRLFTLVSSPDLVVEVEDVLTRPKITERYRPDPVLVRALLTGLRAGMVRPLPLDALPIRCRDPKDDHVLACALGGDADYLVTGDDDLLSLDGHPALGRLRIITPRSFLAILGDGPPY